MLATGHEMGRAGVAGSRRVCAAVNTFGTGIKRVWLREQDGYGRDRRASKKVTRVARAGSARTWNVSGTMIVLVCGNRAHKAPDSWQRVVRCLLAGASPRVKALRLSCPQSHQLQFINSLSLPYKPHSPSAARNCTNRLPGRSPPPW